MTLPFLAAVLVVKNEAAMLPACLASLINVVDEMVVHDTGSSDGTDELAAALGAKVTRGVWAGDFAATRNAAAAGTDATWVLTLDADHRVTADAAALRAALSGHDAFRVQVDEAHPAAPGRPPETRLYRPDRLTWAGRVHERLIPDTERQPERGEIPRDLLCLTHLGQISSGRSGVYPGHG